MNAPSEREDFKMSAVDYTVDGQTYEGYFLAPEGKTNLPVVAIAHAWGGLGDNEIQKAGRVVNELGYAAFAMDVYGKGKRGTTVEENQALMNPLVGNRAELQKRLAGGLAAAKAQPGVDTSKTAAIGFCFGGLCVLDMARAGMDCSASPHSTACSTRQTTFPHRRSAPKSLSNMAGWTRWRRRRTCWPSPRKWATPVPTGKCMPTASPITPSRPRREQHADMGTVYNADADRRSFASLKLFLEELF
jgi:hypothetical protein